MAKAFAVLETTQCEDGEGPSSELFTKLFWSLDKAQEAIREQAKDITTAYFEEPTDEAELRWHTPTTAEAFYEEHGQSFLWEITEHEIV